MSSTFSKIFNIFSKKVDFCSTLCYIVEKKEGGIMSFLENLGLRIRQKRTELDMTQEELGLKVGYTSRSSINKIELGLVDLPQSKIISIAKALQTTPAYIMGWEEPTKEENELLKLIEQLTDEEIEELSRFIDYLISKRK